MTSHVNRGKTVSKTPRWAETVAKYKSQQYQ
jgi:hypothetical protein